MEKTGESEPVNTGPKGNREPLKDAQQGSDIITFMFFLFERSVDCRVLATRNERKGFEEWSAQVILTAMGNLCTNYSVRYLCDSNKNVGEWGLQTFFQNKESGKT